MSRSELCNVDTIPCNENISKFLLWYSMNLTTIYFPPIILQRWNDTNPWTIRIHSSSSVWVWKRLGWASLQLPTNSVTPISTYVQHNPLVMNLLVRGRPPHTRRLHWQWRHQEHAGKLARMFEYMAICRCCNIEWLYVQGWMWKLLVCCNLNGIFGPISVIRGGENLVFRLPLSCCDRVAEGYGNFIPTLLMCVLVYKI